MLAALLPFITNCQSPKDLAKNTEQVKNEEAQTITISSEKFAKITGQVKNMETQTIIISSPDYSKKISLDDKGFFKDTLNVTSGVFTLTDGRNKTFIFLANGYDLKLTIDAVNFSAISFDGEGKESNEYIQNRIEFSKSELSNINAYFELERTEFNAKISKLKRFLNAVPTANVDSSLVSEIAAENKRMIEYLEKSYDVKYASAAKYKKGSPSPKFNNLENYKGGTTSLDDLKGKYVYIDVWATWCPPCKREIPFLKEVEKKYEHKNIVFVSISTDKPNKHEAWKQMIADKQMGGIQLYSGNDQSFSVEYQINSIPRFILIDPDGNIVDANAPRPSDPKLITLFNSLKI